MHTHLLIQKLSVPLQLQIDQCFSLQDIRVFMGYLNESQNLPVFVTIFQSEYRENLF